MNSLVWLAVVLVVVWIVARIFLAVTSALLHLLWIAAIVFFVIWIFRKVTG
ncbi:MAG TPA: hypothetical protein VF551_04810 [Chthoniobacterales bacterium]